MHGDEIETSGDGDQTWMWSRTGEAFKEGVGTLRSGTERKRCHDELFLMCTPH